MMPVRSVSFLIDPFADIRRTICELDVSLLAMIQNPDCLSIHKRQILQVQDDLAIFTFQLTERLQFVDVFCIQVADQPKDGSPIRKSLNP
ncbi:MAG: hypothetical protein ACLPXT_13795 [Terracidiphilus sp.]